MECIAMGSPRYKYDIIANKIIELIARGEYRPGDKLPAEAELTRRFAVSRVTLRESLKKLSMMGIVSIHQGLGTFVNEITPAAFMKPLFPFLAYRKANIEEIYSVRAVLESGACAMAAEHRDEDDIAYMAKLLENMEAAMRGGDFAAFSVHDEAFHKSIQKMCKNEILDMIGDMFHQFINTYLPAINRSAEIIENSLRCHRMIFDAIVNQRQELASILMREHLITAKTNLLAYMDESADVESETL